MIHMYQIDYKKPIHVYFVGIGGISMSGLAEILMSRGFRVSGSDRDKSSITEALEHHGIKVFYGQKEENITKDIDLAVFTAAIHPDNPEFRAVERLGIPHMTRAVLLGEIMRNYETPAAVSGTHGKTTTTSMLSEILINAGTDPTLSVGGILKSISGNVRVGKSGCFVTEACEYTNSFLSLFPKIGIILDIDADHLDFFKDINDIRHSFRRFAGLIPEDGTLIINSTIPDLNEITDGLKCHVVTYGSDSSSDYYPSEISYDEHAHPTYTLHSRDTKSGSVLPDSRITLRIPGEHNVYNSLAAVAAADIYGVGRGTTISSLKTFEGTDRRFELKGQFNGVAVIDDYAHHPTEIRATLNAALKYPHNKIWCVFQSHTYSRTKALMHEFAEALTLADEVILADIYPARETDNLGISAETLQKEILNLGHPCYYFGSFDEIVKFARKNCNKNDLLITMGAGNVYEIGDALVEK